MKVFIKGLNACVMRNQKLLQYEQFIKANGHEIVSFPDVADAILLWTCAFRADHRDASLLTISKILDKYNAIVIVAGCLPAIAGDLLPKNNRLVIAGWNNDVDCLDRIFRTTQSLANFSPVYVHERLCKDAATYRKTTGKDATFHDQFIKLLVSEGCNFKCSYCSERLAFPPYHSVDPLELEHKCREMVEKTGVYDVILLADSLGQYGCDMGTNLPSLVRRLAAIDRRLRFAFNNLHLKNFMEFFDDFKNFILEGRVAHFNIPIQSVSDYILERMNRQYTKKDIIKVFNLFRQLNFKDFDTHIIIGFPGEREKDVDETQDLLLNFNPRYVLVSRYMEAEGADSAKMEPKVPAKVMWERLNRISKALSEASIICNCDGGGLSKERLNKLHGFFNVEDNKNEKKRK